jgi:hypothetical protein
MKKRIVLVAIIPLLTYPCICFASYLVQLTNGSQFVVYQYWEEANQIRFYSHGGAVGIPKGCVREISVSDIPIQTETKRSAIPSADTAGTSAKQDSQTGQTSAEKKSGCETMSFTSYKEKKLRLKAELDKAMERFRQSSMNRDAEANKKAIEDMTRASGQILDLTNTLREKNKGVLPDWWKQL